MKFISSFIGAVVATFAATSGAAFAVICEPATDPNCVNVVPEPGSLALVALAIAGVALVARRKK